MDNTFPKTRFHNLKLSLKKKCLHHLQYLIKLHTEDLHKVTCVGSIRINCSKLFN